MSVEVVNLTKIFNQQKAVNDITFSVSKGEILGFLGPNGAGKSTTMKMATTYLPPTSGSVLINGIDVLKDPLSVRKIIGYLPEHNPLYLDMYIKEYLEFVASLHGIKGKSLKSKIQDIIAMTGLELEKRKKIGQLSKGYRQRVGLAQAMIHDPEVLILDEPTSGLDPNQIIEIRELIKNFSKQKTVIFSTHIMQEVQAMCDRVVIIDRGKIVADDKVENLKGKPSNQQVVTVEFEVAPDIDIFKNIKGIRNLEPEGNKVKIFVEPDMDIRSDIFKLATEKDLSLIGLHKEDASLENIFQQLTKDNIKEPE
ncbi:MAG: gliding motility-associated ABC transporter ATP-binding subunit GldA [Cyclobacteriaceae bacterium]|jgi:ABC-2 type transport system ATP-binding protein